MMTEKGRVLERLLSGQFICQVSDETSWRQLKQPAFAEAINDMLAPLNRVLATAADGNVFYTAYQSLGDPERRHLGQQFQEIASQLRPLTEWLLLVQSTTGQDAPMSEGSPLRLTELQTVIEDTPALAEHLARLARYRLFNSTSPQPDQQLRQIFKRLTEMGYLIKPNPERLVFLATGKIDYLFEVIRFIDESENLQLAERAESAHQQDSLL